MLLNPRERGDAGTTRADVLGVYITDFISPSTAKALVSDNDEQGLNSLDESSEKDEDANEETP